MTKNSSRSSKIGNPARGASASRSRTIPVRKKPRRRALLNSRP